jgi:hypothetical protein
VLLVLVDSKPFLGFQTESAWKRTYFYAPPTYSLLFADKKYRGERLENQQRRGISAACGPICGPHTLSMVGALMEPV